MKFLNVQIILLYIIIDVLAFPRRDNPGLGWKLLFSHWKGTNGVKWYYIYRPLQFILAAAGLYFCLPVFQPLAFEWACFWHLLRSLLPVIAYLLAFSLYVTDLWYYILNLEFETLLAFEYIEEDTFWLQHSYQLGRYTWGDKFSIWQFMIYSITGTIFLIISNII